MCEIGAEIQQKIKMAKTKSNDETFFINGRWGYAGWNTNGNTLGTIIANGFLLHINLYTEDSFPILNMKLHNDQMNGDGKIIEEKNTPSKAKGLFEIPTHTSNTTIWTTSIVNQLILSILPLFWHRPAHFSSEFLLVADFLVVVSSSPSALSVSCFTHKL